MTTYRTPALYEYWRVRPRPSPEWVCKACKVSLGSNWRSGEIVYILSLPEDLVGGIWACSCGAVSPIVDGLVRTGHLSADGKWLLVPVSWLEPLSESPTLTDAEGGGDER